MSESCESLPISASIIKLTESVLEQPGFPHKKSGILLSMQTYIKNTFSFKAVLCAIPSPILILSNKFFCS